MTPYAYHKTMPRYPTRQQILDVEDDIPSGSADDSRIRSFKKNGIMSNASAYMNAYVDPEKVNALGRKGAYGSIRSVKITPTSRKRFRSMYDRMTYKTPTFKLPPTTGSTVIVKVTKAKQEILVEELAREIEIHRLLSTSPPVVIAGVKYSSRDTVPPLYFGGLDPRIGSVVVMGVARGVPSDRGMTARQYVALEKALRSMLFSGVLHNDLHKDNVFFHGKRATIFDFGLSVSFPKSYRDQIVRHVRRDPMVSLSALVDHVIKYSNRVMRQRGFPEHHSNGKILREYYERRVVDPENIPRERRAAFLGRRAR